MPFGDTRIISRRWSDHHAAVIPTSFNAEVSIGYPVGEPHYDPETDETTQDYSADYVGAARVDHEAGRQAVESAGQILVGMPYLVQLPAEVATFRRGARVKITAAINDEASTSPTPTASPPTCGRPGPRGAWPRPVPPRSQSATSSATPRLSRPSTPATSAGASPARPRSPAAASAARSARPPATARTSSTAHPAWRRTPTWGQPSTGTPGNGMTRWSRSWAGCSDDHTHPA